MMQKIQMQLPRNIINKYDPAYNSYLPANSRLNSTPFKDPEDNSALTKNNGVVYNTFRQVMDFQNPDTPWLQMERFKIIR